jgi:hypothetical protein
MVFVLFVLAESRHSVSLYGIFIRPHQNPLELYPLTHIPLCITDPIPGTDTFTPHKCKRRLMTIPSLEPTESAAWCTTFFTPEIRTQIQRLFSRDFELAFDSKSQISTTRLGPKASMLYTHFTFTFFPHKRDFFLLNVTGTSPQNISRPSITFTYQFVFTDSISPPSKKASLEFFFWIAGIFLFFVTLLIIKPNFLSKPLNCVVATVPSHNFLMVVLTGAGAGVFAFILAIVTMTILNIEWMNSWWIGLSIPDAASSLANGLITSLICTWLRLKDVASALYFAPLLFPVIILTVSFSVLWIPICLGSCLALPMKAIFVYILAAIFVKLPINLFVGVVIGDRKSVV